MIWFCSLWGRNGFSERVRNLCPRCRFTGRLLYKWVWYMLARCRSSWLRICMEGIRSLAIWSWYSWLWLGCKWVRNMLRWCSSSWLWLWSEWVWNFLCMHWCSWLRFSCERIRNLFSCLWYWISRCCLWLRCEGVRYLFSRCWRNLLLLCNWFRRQWIRDMLCWRWCRNLLRWCWRSRPLCSGCCKCLFSFVHLRWCCYRLVRFLYLFDSIFLCWWWSSRCGFSNFVRSRRRSGLSWSSNSRLLIDCCYLIIFWRNMSSHLRLFRLNIFYSFQRNVAFLRNAISGDRFLLSRVCSAHWAGLEGLITVSLGSVCLHCVSID